MRTLSRLFGKREAEERGGGKATERGRRTALRFGAVLGALAFLVLFLPVREVQAQLTVIATIPVGTGPAGLGVNPNTNRIYVANGGSNTVSVIDGATNAVLATILVTAADGVGVNTITNRVYVNGGIFPAQTVSVIDGTPGSLTENTVIATIPVPGRQLIAARGIGVNPITNHIYVPSFDPGGAVVRIDGSTNAVSLIGVAANPFAATVNPTTNRIYIGHGSFFFRSRITVIDGATNAVSDGAMVGLQQVSIGVNSATNRIYVKKGDPSRGEPFGVVVVDSNTNAVLTSIPVVGEIGHALLAVNSTTNRVYVANAGTSTVSVIDGTPGSPTENTFVASVGVGSSPFGVGVNPVTNRIYVSNPGSNTVSVIEDVLMVTIDIKPGEDPPSINPGSKGTIPVAILSSPTFDATTQVDRTSLTFGRTGDEQSLAFCNSSGEDVNGDGLLDLVCHFNTQQTGFQAGDTVGVLKGKTLSNIPIQGSDSVSIVP